MPEPTYEEVCGKGTGHAEAVRVVYDPEQVSYEQLLDLFWENHNPTQANGQGVNLGSQYRAAIFYKTPEQEEAARASKAALEASGRFSRPITTLIEPAAPWWPAEDYHQQYYEKQRSRSGLFR